MIVMKKFLLLAATVLIGLTSCEKDDASAIIGTWEAVSIEMKADGIKLDLDIKEAGVEMTFTFKADGTGTLTEVAQGESITDGFNYSVGDGMLTIDYDGEAQSIPITIDGNEMTMVFDGEMLDEPGASITMHFKRK